MADLQLRQLGSTGADVSELALGALTFGREADEAGSARILGAYLGAGGNFIAHAAAAGHRLDRRVLRARMGPGHAAG
jgi:aryl-alcohol dehydrogenase-like predicted oxidoreductase